MKTWTIDEMLDEDPCDDYTRAVLTELWAGRERLSLPDVLALDIPASDQVWVACRPGALPDALRDTWIVGIVTRRGETHALRCGVPAVEAWERAWLDGPNRGGGRAWRESRAATWTASAGALPMEQAWVMNRECARQVADLRILIEGTT